MFLQGLNAALLSWRNSHVGSTWSWYMMWSGEIFFRSLERSNFLSVWPSSFDGDLSDRINSPIAIVPSCYFADQVLLIVLFCRLRFARLCYFIDGNLCDRVIFSWSRVWTPAKQYDLFYWSWVQFPGQIACLKLVWFMAMSLAPTNGELGWWGKKPHGREKTRGDYFKRKT